MFKNKYNVDGSLQRLLSLFWDTTGRRSRPSFLSVFLLRAPLSTDVPFLLLNHSIKCPKTGPLLEIPTVRAKEGYHGIFGFMTLGLTSERAATHGANKKEWLRREISGGLFLTAHAPGEAMGLDRYWIDIRDQYQCLSNCSPTPPLTQQQSIDNKFRVNVGLGEG